MYFTTVSWLKHGHVSMLWIIYMIWCLLCRGWVVSATHLWCAVIKAYLVANLSTQCALHLLGHPLGHCDGSHSAGLGDADFAIFTNTYTKKESGGWREKPMIPSVSQLKNSCLHLLDEGTVEVVLFSRCQSHRWQPEKCSPWQPQSARLCADRSAGVSTLWSPILLIWTFSGNSDQRYRPADMSVKSWTDRSKYWPQQWGTRFSWYPQTVFKLTKWVLLLHF